MSEGNSIGDIADILEYLRVKCGTSKFYGLFHIFVE